MHIPECTHMSAHVHTHTHAQQKSKLKMANWIKHLHPCLNQAGVVVTCKPSIKEAETDNPSGKS